MMKRELEISAFFIRIGSRDSAKVVILIIYLDSWRITIFLPECRTNLYLANTFVVNLVRVNI